MKRRKYTSEFKEEACKSVIVQGNKISQTARNIGIAESLLGRWIREFKNQSTLSGADKDNSKKIRDLEIENKRLRTEREILKKAMAYFVEVPQ